MSFSSIVLNASPLICLSKSGLSEVLPALFEQIVVPPSVINEVLAGNNPDAGIRVLLRQQWLHPTGQVILHPLVLSWDLGKGESEVLSYALDKKTYCAVIDDLAARRCAATLDCRHIGTVGVIVLAKKKGVVKSVRESLQRLLAAGLWLSEDFVREVSERFD